MKPTISTTRTGKISIDNTHVDFDFFINAEGKIIRRDIKMPCNKNFPLQTLSLFEAGQLYDPNINEMIIGCDEDDKIMLSSEAFDFFEEKRCKIKLLPIDEAITYWNRYEGHAVGLFHLSTHHN